MTRDEAIKSLYCRGDMTKEDIVNKIYDAHEANLKKACEILEGANLAEIERHFAECKAKDERIAELFSELSATYVKCFHKDIENKRLKGRIAGLEAKLDSLAQFLEGA